MRRIKSFHLDFRCPITVGMSVNCKRNSKIQSSKYLIMFELSILIFIYTKCTPLELNVMKTFLAQNWVWNKDNQFSEWPFITIWVGFSPSIHSFQSCHPQVLRGANEIECAWSCHFRFASASKGRWKAIPMKISAFLLSMISLLKNTLSTNVQVNILPMRVRIRITHCPTKLRILTRNAW